MHLPSARHLGPLVLMWLVSLVVLVAEKDLGSVAAVLRRVPRHGDGRDRAAGRTRSWARFCSRSARRPRTSFSRTCGSASTSGCSPFADAAGKGYQLVQSLFALAAGGIIGVGPGRGSPTRIPFVATDFIFSAIGEELGLLGGVAIVSAYLVFCLRGLATAVRARSDMASLTATGLVATMGLQAFVIIGGVTRLIPLTGITLPFICYGGSSIVSNFILLALLMRAGDDAPAEGERAVPADDSGVLGRSALYRRLTGVAVLVVGAHRRARTEPHVGAGRRRARPSTTTPRTRATLAKQLPGGARRDPHVGRHRAGALGEGRLGHVHARLPVRHRSPRTSSATTRCATAAPASRRRRTTCSRRPPRLRQLAPT